MYLNFSIWKIALGGEKTGSHLVGINHVQKGNVKEFEICASLMQLTKRENENASRVIYL